MLLDKILGGLSLRNVMVFSNILAEGIERKQESPRALSVLQGWSFNWDLKGQRWYFLYHSVPNAWLAPS